MDSNLWLDIPVTNVPLMHDCKASQKLFGDFFCFCSDDWIFEIFTQVAAVDVLHRQVNKVSSNILVPTVKLNE